MMLTPTSSVLLLILHGGWLNLRVLMYTLQERKIRESCNGCPARSVNSLSIPVHNKNNHCVPEVSTENRRLINMPHRIKVVYINLGPEIIS
jgi:hypothetical protein